MEDRILKILPWVFGVLLALCLVGLGFAVYEAFWGGYNGFHCVVSHTVCGKGCYQSCDEYVRDGTTPR
jgi:hypothetical protein